MHLVIVQSQLLLLHDVIINVNLIKSLKSKAGSLNKSSCLAPALGATKFTTATDMILVPLCCAAQV